MPIARPSPRHLLRETLLNLGAGLGVLCVLAAVAAYGFGIRPLVFRSGSMGPAIQTGALGLARTVPAAELAVGDVVSVVNDRGVRVTHRVLAVRYADPAATLTLRGDANPAADPEPYVVTGADRLFFSVNGVGYAVSALSSPWGIFGAGMLAGALIMYAFGRRRPREESSPVSALAGTATVVVLVATALVVRPAALDTAAAFTDSSTARTGTLRARQLSAPVLSCGPGPASNNTVTVSWTAGETDATAYQVLVTRDTGADVTATVAATPRTYTRNRPTLSLTENGTITVRTVIGTWISPPSNAATYRISLLLSDTCST